MPHPTQPLSSLVTLLNGRAFKPTDWGQVGLPIIRIQNLNGEKGFNYFAGKVDEKNLVRPGELLFSWSGSIGSSFGPYEWKGPEAVLNQHIFKVVLREGVEIDKHYLLHALRFVTSAIEAKSHGSAGLVHVTKGELERHPIPVPGLSVQLQIAQFLNTWDEAIALQTRQLGQLKRRKNAIAQELLLGKKRLIEFQQRTWDTQQISEVAQHVSQRNSNGASLIVLSCTKYNGLVDSLTYFGRQMYSDDLSTYKVVPRNTFAYATNHIEEGSIGYQRAYDQALISPMYTVFRTNASEVDDDFLYHLLKSETYIQVYRRNMSGSIDRRGGLRWNDFSQISIPAIELDEQRAIADVLTTAANEIILYERKLKALREQKRGLLQQLLTGQILLS